MNPSKEKYAKAVAEVTVFNERDVVGTILDDDRYPEGGGLNSGTSRVTCYGNVF